MNSDKNISDTISTSDETVPSEGADRAADSPETGILRRLLAQKDDVLRLLKDVALAMNEASSADHALQYVVERICAFKGWPVGHVYLVSPTQHDLLIPTSIFHFDDPGRFEAFRAVTLDTSFRKGEGLPGRVMAKQVPLWIEDVSNDDNFPRARLVEEIGISSGFAFPLLMGDRVIGVLEFFSSEAVEPDYDLLDAMANVGAQLVRVIEREHAAEAIRASEERLRALTGSMNEAIITADESGRITGWGGGAERIFGYSEQDAQGRDLVMLMPQRYVDPHRAGMARFHATGEARLIGDTIQVEAERKDGTEFPVELSLSTWQAGGERFFTAVIRDVTERKEAENRLRERDLQLERAQRIAHLGSWHFDVAHGRIAWSDELCRIYGIAPGAEPTFEEYIGMIHPDDRERAVAIAKQALETQEPFSFYHRIVRRSDGEERILHGEGEVVADDAGHPVLMFGTGLDVTELKRAEENLRERERLFRLLAENMTDIILLQDPAGDVLYASPSCERVLGIDADALKGRNLFERLHPSDEERLRRGAHQHMLEGKPYTQTIVRARREAGNFVWLELASKPIYGEDGAVEHILASARDVTERIKAEEEASRSRSQLETRNRELQDFAYVASHDLQEPLRKIQAFSDLLEDDYGHKLDEEGLGHIERIKDAAVRMSTLISDLLQFSRITTRGEPFSKIDLNEVIDGVLSDLEVAVSEADAEIVVEDLPEIEADALQMRQLFQNLIGNGLKFRQDGVRPRIRVAASISKSRTEPRGGPSEVCRISVADNGIGFDAKYADRIFKPFQRLHHRRAYEGTGMGLAICRRIVERHDGALTVESAPDKGATFTVELPVRRSVST